MTPFRMVRSHSRKGIPSAHMHWASISDLATLSGRGSTNAPTPQHARICHSAIVSIPVASRQDTAVAGVRTPSIHENPHSLLIVSAGKTPPTCDEIVDLRHSACGHNEITVLCDQSGCRWPGRSVQMCRPHRHITALRASASAFNSGFLGSAI